MDKRTAKKLHPASDYDLLLTESEAENFNGKLGDLLRLIDTIEQRFEMDKIIYSAEMVIDKLNETEKPKTKKEAPSNVLFDFIDRYIQDHSKTREPGSLIVYRSLKSHLQAYQQETKRKVTFDKIDYSFFQSFQNFLIGRTKIVKDNQCRC